MHLRVRMRERWRKPTGDTNRLESLGVPLVHLSHPMGCQGRLGEAPIVGRFGGGLSTQVHPPRRKKHGPAGNAARPRQALDLTTGEISVHLVGPPAGAGLRDDLHRRDIVKVHDGQVSNRPLYAAVRVDLAGHKDILGMWAGDGDGESTKFWYAV